MIIIIFHTVRALFTSYTHCTGTEPPTGPFSPSNADYIGPTVVAVLVLLFAIPMIIFVLTVAIWLQHENFKLKSQLLEQSQHQEIELTDCCENKIAQEFATMAKHIEEKSPTELKPVIFLEAIRTVVETMIKNLDRKSEHFSDFLRNVRESANRVWLKVVDEHSSPARTARVDGPQSTEHDGISTLKTQAMDRFKYTMEQLDQMIGQKE